MTDSQSVVSRDVAVTDLNKWLSACELDTIPEGGDTSSLGNQSAVEAALHLIGEGRLRLDGEELVLLVRTPTTMLREVRFPPPTGRVFQKLDARHASSIGHRTTVAAAWTGVPQVKLEELRQGSFQEVLGFLGFFL